MVITNPAMARWMQLTIIFWYKNGGILVRPTLVNVIVTDRKYSASDTYIDWGFIYLLIWQFCNTTKWNVGKLEVTHIIIIIDVKNVFYVFYFKIKNAFFNVFYYPNVFLLIKKRKAFFLYP